MGKNRYFAHIQEHDQWKQAIQGYLASISFADTMIGRVLDSLERGPNKDNTIVVLWSDHGWHLGEKQHWQKYTAWRVCSRVPLIMRVPEGVPGLANGTVAGGVCQRSVSLVSLYRTLLELSGLPEKEDAAGPSLVPLLENPSAQWPHVAITQLSRPNSLGISGERWRYIHYENGDEELYDIQSDRYEWKNLAGDPEHAAKIARLKQHMPETPAKFVPSKSADLVKLRWRIASDEPAPASKPVGKKLDVFFDNKSGAPVKVFWMTTSGKRKPYGTLEAGWRKPQQSRRGAVWLITDLNDQPLGHFVVGKQPAQAIVPKRE